MNQRRSTMRILGTIVLLGAAPAAWAIPIGTTGGADELLDADFILPSSSANEQSFLEQALGLPGGTFTGFFSLADSGGDNAGPPIEVSVSPRVFARPGRVGRFRHERECRLMRPLSCTSL